MMLNCGRLTALAVFDAPGPPRLLARRAAGSAERRSAGIALVSLEEKMHTASDAGHALILSPPHAQGGCWPRTGRVNVIRQAAGTGKWHVILPTNSHHTE